MGHLVNHIMIRLGNAVNSKLSDNSYAVFVSKNP